MTATIGARRLPGGRMPKQKLAASYFFGPLILGELERHAHSVVKAAQSMGQGSEDVLPARVTYALMAEMCGIELPPTLTIPAQRATRKAGGGFSLKFERKVFSRLHHSFFVEAGEGSLRLRSAIQAEDFDSMWQILLLQNFGANYHALPSYRALMANIATVAAGIELFLFQHWPTEGEYLLKESPRIWRELDTSALESIAVRTDVSIGVVLAAVVQLAGRKSSATVRAALAKADWNPLHQAVWGPLFPSFRTHPFFRLFEEKLQNPDLKARVGRPEAMPLGPVLTPPPKETSAPLVPAAPAVAPAARPESPFRKPQNL